MNLLVAYESKYGFTKTYAQWLAGDLGATLLPAKEVTPGMLQACDGFVYGGGLYAGGVSGIALLTKNFEALRHKPLYLFTVGAADVADDANVAHIRASLARTLTPDMLQTIHLYHLRGGMRYSQMSFVHRTMMNMMLKALRKKPENEQTADDKVMLETWGQDVDFTDHAALAPLVADIKAYMAAQ